MPDNNIRLKFTLLLEVLWYLSPEMATLATTTGLVGFTDVKQLFVSRCKDKYTGKLTDVNVLP